MPLSGTSMHPAATHRDWPISETARMHHLSLHVESSRFIREAKIRKLVRFFMEPETIENCRRWHPPMFPRIVQRRALPDTCLSRIVVRFHPCRSGLGMKLRQLCTEWSAPGVGLSLAIGGRPLIQVAYSKADKPLASLVLSACGL